VGLLDYYRQFEGMSEEEVNEGLRREAYERKQKALTRVETLDLSQTTWPELPHHNIANAITFVARRGMQTYSHARRSDLRHELANRHDISLPADRSELDAEDSLFGAENRRGRGNCDGVAAPLPGQCLIPWRPRAAQAHRHVDRWLCSSP